MPQLELVRWQMYNTGERNLARPQMMPGMQALCEQRLAMLHVAT